MCITEVRLGHGAGYQHLTRVPLPGLVVIAGRRHGPTTPCDAGCLLAINFNDIDILENVLV